MHINRPNVMLLMLIVLLMVWFGFVLFNDTWSQYGHSVSCITILSLKLQIIRSDIRSHIKWAVSLVIGNGHFSFLQGLACLYIWDDILTLSSPRSCC